jgi:hypothetical protein
LLKDAGTVRDQRLTQQILRGDHALASQDVPAGQRAERIDNEEGFAHNALEAGPRPTKTDIALA